VTPVRAADQAAQLPRQLVRIDVRQDFAGCLGLAGRTGQARDPVTHFLDNRVADRARPAVELRRRRLEEAAAREDVPLHVGEVGVAKRPQPAYSDASAQPWLQDFLSEDPSGLLHRGQLKLLLGTEMREKTALADAELARQAL
jgi:hypothetical protein